MSRFTNLKVTFLVFCLLGLIACQPEPTGDTEQTESQARAVIQLDDDNIEEFSQILAEHNQLTLDELLHGFNEAKEKEDSHIFVSYRNFHWTPSYIEKKEYYQQVREKNLAYISQSPIQRLFDHFDRLIYIGLDLKHGLKDDNQALLRKTFAIIEHDKKEIKAVLKLIANTQQS